MEKYQQIIAHIVITLQLFLQVRIAGPKGSRSQTLYNSDSCVISLAAK